LAAEARQALARRAFSLPGDAYIFVISGLVRSKGGTQMMKGIVFALALGLAVPAFAKSDAAKDVSDKASDTKDDVKDKLHTDSGAAKVGRHADKATRNVKKGARHTKNDAKAKVNDATK
jgi:hypothetical protein